MKLLIITQKVDTSDDNLGFFHRWIEKFAQKTDKLYVACLSRGEFDLPHNVEVYSIGKERNTSRIGQFFRLQKYLLRNLKDVDGVFVHMCPIYAIASAPLVKIFGKRMVMWYTHKSKNWKVWLAEKFVDRVYTASKESFRTKSRKVEICGHGIDVNIFYPSADSKGQNSRYKILTVGRIEPSKNLETQIDAMDILINEEGAENIEMIILGSKSSKEHPHYLGKLAELVKQKGLERFISFAGPKQHSETIRYYRDTDLFLNSSRTGSIDKAVLEAMACGALVLVSNEAFYPMLRKFGPSLLFKEGDYKSCAYKIKKLLALPKEERTVLAQKLRKIVTKHHNLDHLIENFVMYFKS